MEEEGERDGEERRGEERRRKEDRGPEGEKRRKEKEKRRRKWSEGEKERREGRSSETRLKGQSSLPVSDNQTKAGRARTHTTRLTHTLTH